MNTAEFLRQYEVRAPNIMWMLGAGASAAAGVPTAFHMIWDFKRMLYCSAQKVPISACEDLSSRIVRARLQNYFDAAGTFPSNGSDEEYSHYFRSAYPDEQDRRRYIDRLVANATPSHGHIALGCLLKLDKARMVWTTNFDGVVEDAASAVFGSTTKLVTSTLDSAQLALEALNEGRWPLLIKLHGDFRSRQLKNTSDELQAQDAKLRKALVEACKRYGLAAIGYSGRDHSVMDALEEGLDNGNGYPSGLFWFHRSDSPVMPRVTDLIARAHSLGIQANLIEAETFDELLPDILLLIKDLPAELTEVLNKHAPRISEAPMPAFSGRWPVLRTNALPILSYPSLCRRIVCKIGGTKEVRQAIETSGVNVIAARRQSGVIAFGTDSDVRKAFDSFDITEFDAHSIEPRRLGYESAELGLLYDAVYLAIKRERPFKLERIRRHHMIAVDEDQADHVLFNPLRNAVTDLAGTIPNTSLKWAEAVRIGIEYWLGQLWLLIEPTIWVERTDDDELHFKSREFIRARLAGRFNPKWNELLQAWSQIITDGQEECELRTFGIGDGVDAVFTISSLTGFSKREDRQ
jgi:NAD-dependent SIR2 family protein deacetylase